MENSLELLVGNRFQAECQEPKPIPQRNEIVLKRNASCLITKQTDERELRFIQIKFEGWIINARNIMSHPKELCCFECYCETKDFHKHHEGTHKIRPFSIFRIEKSPILCRKRIYGEIEPYVEIRDIISKK